MSETLTQTISRITAFIKEKAPTVDVSPGSVFSELILNLESQVQNQIFSDIDDIASIQSIQSALTSLTDTYSPVIDAIASNYNVSRNQGTTSTGIIKVYVANFTSYNIPSGTIFTQPTLGYTYSTISSVSVVTGTPSGAQHRLVIEGSSYYFLLNVVAQTIGQITAISNGTQFILNNTSQIQSFVSAQALGAFSAGLNTETDKQLIARFRNGLGVNNLLSQNSITNKLESIYPNFQDAYISDVSSPINTRSLNNPLNIKIPGCVDVWVKDGITIPSVTFNITTSTYTDNAWIVPITSDLAPGFYRIVNVQNITDNSLNYLTFTVGYDYDTLTPNLLNSAKDARFSIYQNATLRVTDTAPTMEAPSSTFKVTVLAAPDLSSMQALFLDDNNRIPCADYLVKGIVPCMVSMKISLVKNNIGDIIDTTAIKTDIFNYINGLGSNQSIAVSQIVNICHKHNIQRVDLPMILTGTILAPSLDDSNIIIIGNDFLTIPNLPNQGISPHNTMFFVGYFDDNGNQNINITVQ